MSDYIYDAITNIDDWFIEEARVSRLQSHKLRWRPYVAAAAALALIVGIGQLDLPQWGSYSASSTSSSTTTTTSGNGVTESAVDESVMEESVMQDTTTDSSSVTNTVAQVYFTEQPAQMQVELVSWQAEGFQGVVITSDDETLFPQDAELTIMLEPETEIHLADGTLFAYDSDAPNAAQIGWQAGTLVTVTFTAYEAYLADNHFYNRAYASEVEVG